MKKRKLYLWVCAFGWSFNYKSRSSELKCGFVTDLYCQARIEVQLKWIFDPHPHPRVHVQTAGCCSALRVLQVWTLKSSVYSSECLLCLTLLPLDWTDTETLLCLLWSHLALILPTGARGHSCMCQPWISLDQCKPIFVCFNLEIYCN